MTASLSAMLGRLAVADRKPLWKRVPVLTPAQEQRMLDRIREDTIKVIVAQNAHDMSSRRDITPRARRSTKALARLMTSLGVEPKTTPTAPAGNPSTPNE